MTKNIFPCIIARIFSLRLPSTSLKRKRILTNSVQGWLFYRHLLLFAFLIQIHYAADNFRHWQYRFLKVLDQWFWSPLNEASWQFKILETINRTIDDNYRYSLRNIEIFISNWISWSNAFCQDEHKDLVLPTKFSIDTLVKIKNMIGSHWYGRKKIWSSRTSTER